MSVNALQTSFAAGELAPSLFARTDLAKYHSGAALLRNFFVDYRGGASTRCGTKYSLQAKNSAFPVRLIPFSASFTQTYALEFGQNYLRFHANGNPVLETATVISAATRANPAVITDNAHGYSIGDWVFISGVVGMTQLNGRYFIITATTTNTFTIANLNGVAINSSAYTAYASGGTAQRVYTIQTPYLASDLALLKFAQDVNIMVFCHPSYQPQVLTFTNSTSWALTTIFFGATIGPPTASLAAATTLSASGVDYAFVVTSVDSNGQESGPSAIISLLNANNYKIQNGTTTISWAAVAGAQYYNVYKAEYSYAGVVPAGSSLGFVGFTTGTNFIDSGIDPDFSETPPIPQNPFQGAGVFSIAVTARGTYTVVPAVVIASAPAGGQTATAVAVLSANSVAVNTGGSGGGRPPYAPGDAVVLSNGVVVIVATTNVDGSIATLQPLTFPGSSRGSIAGTGGATPANPVAQVSSNGTGTGATFNIVWGVDSVSMVQQGAGYGVAPAVTFSVGVAAAVATLGPATSGNPAVPGFFDQRLVLAAPPGAPQTYFMSQPGAAYNFNTSNPTQGDDAITASIRSGQLNIIRALVPMPSGLIVLNSRSAWQINGGSAGAAVSAINEQAQSQAYNGCSDVPPIVATYDILYVQAKGNSIRDLSYNFYTNIYTGTDISVLSNHLFFGYTINEWAFAEEPFKTVWAVRSDGILLALTFLKEQEIYGWSHCDTKGQFKSVCSITESTVNGNVDATYVVVQRTVNGNVVQYIERIADRFFPYGLEDAWALDAALQSSGTSPAATLSASSGAIGTGVTFIASASVFSAPNVGNVIRMGGGIATITGFTSGTQVTGTITQAITAITPDDPANTPVPQASGSWTLWAPSTTFTGLDHLEGQTLTALIDGAVYTGLLVTAGTVTLPVSGTKVLLGLPFTAQLQTMYLDVGEPTVQGKRKQIAALTVRVANSRGLKAGRTFNTLVQIKEAGIPILVPSGTLASTDERVVMDPRWDVPGQICIQQNNPFPATILGVIPEITVGDTAK